MDICPSSVDDQWSSVLEKRAIMLTNVVTRDLDDDAGVCIIHCVFRALNMAKLECI